MSIRRRLLVALLSALALTGLAASAGTWVAARQAANEQFDYQLQQMALTLRDQRLQGPAELFAAWDYDFVVQMWGPRGELVYLSNRGIVLPQVGTGFQTLAVQGEAWRVFTLDEGGRTIQVAAPVSLRSDRASAMALRILVPILAAIPLFGILIWLLVGRELEPLERIARAIRRREPASLEPLATGRLPQEVQPMVSELNALLARLREALDTQKRFTADAAHELRSPVAALALQVQLAERAHTPEGRASALKELSRGIERARRLVQQLLDYARLEPGVNAQPFGPVDLAQLARETVGTHAARAEKLGVDLGAEAPGSAVVAGSENELRSLIENLVDNALRYAPRDSAVTVSARAAGSGVALEVVDAGPGIPAEERERVFERFHRVQGDLTSGSGLGLSIAKAIVERHRGSILVADACPGAGRPGLAVRVEIPLSLA